MCNPGPVSRILPPDQPPSQPSTSSCALPFTPQCPLTHLLHSQYPSPHSALHPLTHLLLHKLHQKRGGLGQGGAVLVASLLGPLGLLCGCHDEWVAGVWVEGGVGATSGWQGCGWQVVGADQKARVASLPNAPFWWQPGQQRVRDPPRPRAACAPSLLWQPRAQRPSPPAGVGRGAEHAGCRVAEEQQRWGGAWGGQQARSPSSTARHVPWRARAPPRAPRAPPPSLPPGPRAPPPWPPLWRPCLPAALPPWPPWLPPRLPPSQP